MTDALREALQELVDAWDGGINTRPSEWHKALKRARTALQEPAPAVQPEMPKSLYWRNPAPNAAAGGPSPGHTFTLQAGAAPSQLVEDARRQAIEECAAMVSQKLFMYADVAECVRAIRALGAKSC